MRMLITRFYEYLSFRSAFLRKLAKLYYTPMIKRELKKINIQKEDKILFVGSGPLPVSALLIQKFTHAKITLVDYCEKSINTSKAILKKERVDMEYIKAYADEVDLSKYSIIYVAKQVQPKACIVNHYIHKISPSTKIVCRKRRQDRCHYYEESFKASCLIIV